MKLVRQRHRNDCGIACAAMLAGVSYEEASDAAAPIGKRRSRTNETSMYLILRNLGVKGKLPLVGGKPNGTNALLKCNRSERRLAGVKGWHWCVLGRRDAASFRPARRRQDAPNFGAHAGSL